MVNLRSHGNMGVAPSADSAQKFLEGQMSKQKRIAGVPSCDYHRVDLRCSFVCEFAILKRCNLISMTCYSHLL